MTHKEAGLSVVEASTPGLDEGSAGWTGAGANSRGSGSAPGSRSAGDPSWTGPESELMEVIERLSGRLLAGEAVEIEAILAENPAHAAALRGLWPSIRGLASLDAKGEAERIPRFAAGKAADEGGGWLFGDYRLIREVGRGGMGIVYEARQLDLDRRVALKLLPHGVIADARAVQRFRLEAQVASWLQHAHIVPIYAVGSAEGTPFYAMQFVEGGSLADLIDSLQAPGMSVDGSTPAPDPDRGRIDALAAGLLSGRYAPSRIDPEGGPAPTGVEPGPRAHGPVASHRPTASRAYIRSVVRLGIQAAEALAYAHDQGVVHRDVKPANLLLDRRGCLWVADFGMADVQGDAGLTATGDLPGTLRYMSPEQAAGRRALVDRRTDLYSLGATLYELLALTPAVPGSDRQEVFRRIAEAEPEPLRRLNPAVPPDLATVLATAMAKDPSGRYETARHLAEDLGRFLEGRPIAARPVGAARRAWRWCRRKPLQAGMAAALAMAVAVGFVGITWSWREAVRQKGLLIASQGETRRQAAAVEATNRYLVDKLLVQSEPAESPVGGRVTLLEVLDRAAAGVGAAFEGQPEVEVALRLAIGRTYHGLGEHSKSEPHYRAAYALSRRAPGGAALMRVESAAELGHNLSHLGRLAEAEPRLREARAESLAALEPQHPIALRADQYLADFLFEMGRYAESEALYRAHLEAARRAPAADLDVIYPALCNLGIAILRQGKAAEAEAHYRAMLADPRIARGANWQDRSATLNNLGTALLAQGKASEAEPLLRESLERSRESLGARHPGTMMALFNLGRAQASLGRGEEGERLVRESLELHRQVQGPGHPATLRVTSTLAGMLAERGRSVEAESLLRPCLDAQRRLLGREHPEAAITAKRLDSLLNQRIAAGGRRP